MQRHPVNTSSTQDDLVVPLAEKGVVKQSRSGQVSVSIGDVSEAPTFKRDLESLSRIRALSAKVGRAARR